MNLLLELTLGFAIGLALGLLGGGGSILTVPALVYLVGQSPQAAIATSLAIVGTNSMVGASFHRAQGTLRWPVALVFGGVGMALAYLTGGLAKQFAPSFLLVLFAGLMLVIGGLMLTHPDGKKQAAVPPRWAIVIASGAGVGALTGLLGVGGGFLIVPALVMLVGLPMAEAVGTSLVIITMNSVAALLGRATNLTLDWALLLVFTGAGLAGTLLGARWAKRLPAQKLRQGFSFFVIALALFLLYDNLPKLVR